jgi:uncharacterized membrane protein
MSIEHIHPMIVHFPIVLAVMALLFDLWAVAIARRAGGPFTSLQPGAVMLAGAGLMAVAAYFFGDMALDVAMSRGFSEAQLETHEGWGTTTAIVLAVIGLLRFVMWRRQLDRSSKGAALAVALGVAAVVMVSVTAYFGGQLVYGLGVNVKPLAG